MYQQIAVHAHPNTIMHKHVNSSIHFRTNTIIHKRVNSSIRTRRLHPMRTQNGIRRCFYDVRVAGRKCALFCAPWPSLHYDIGNGLCVS